MAEMACNRLKITDLMAMAGAVLALVSARTPVTAKFCEVKLRYYMLSCKLSQGHFQ